MRNNDAAKIKIFEWEDIIEPKCGCISQRIATNRNVVAEIYFNSNSAWSGNSPFTAYIHFRGLLIDAPWYKIKFDTAAEAKSFVDSRLKDSGYETLQSHLKTLL